MKNLKPPKNDFCDSKFDRNGEKAFREINAHFENFPNGVLWIIERFVFYIIKHDAPSTSDERIEKFVTTKMIVADLSVT